MRNLASNYQDAILELHRIVKILINTLTVVVLRMISGSSLSSGTTSSIKRGTAGGAGGGERGIIAAFLALEKNLMYTGYKHVR